MKIELNDAMVTELILNDSVSYETRKELLRGIQIHETCGVDTIAKNVAALLSVLQNEPNYYLDLEDKGLKTWKNAFNGQLKDDDAEKIVKSVHAIAWGIHAYGT